MTEQNNPELQPPPVPEPQSPNGAGNYIPLPVIIGALGAIIMVPILLMIVTASPNAGVPASTPTPGSSLIVQPAPVTGNTLTGVGLGVGEPEISAVKPDDLSKSEKQDVKADRKATATAVAAARSQRARAAATPVKAEVKKQNQQKIKTGKTRQQSGKTNATKGAATPEAEPVGSPVSS